MPRNTDFHPLHEPLRASASLNRQDQHTTGAFSFLNPTRARYTHDPLARLNSISSAPVSSPHIDSPSSPQRVLSRATSDEQPASSLGFQWRSRDNRKGRHTLLVEPPSDDASNAPYLTPRSTSSLSEIVRGIGAMFTTYPYWDVSYLVATIFTLGSVIWVMNAFFVFLPLVRPQTEFEGEESIAGGWTAFIGATVFEVGSVLLMLEAINENRTGCFGWALERAVEGPEGGKTRVAAVKGGCKHHHANKKNFLGKGTSTAAKGSTMGSGATSEEEDAHKHASADARNEHGGNGAEDKNWQWYPSWHDLTTHYFYELGFLACSAQLIGATVFWVSGFTALPYIYNMLPSQEAIDGAYWVPQVVGGSGFIMSGLLFMLETQDKWYKPAFKVLGWHIGFWNLIGAFGFTLCGALGPAYANTGAQFEASLATFWGSWAFLIGSLVQWYESLDTHPVEEATGMSQQETTQAKDVK